MNVPEPVELAMVVPSARREGGGDVWLGGLLRHLPGLGIAPLVVFERDGELVELAAGHGCRPVVAAGPGDDAMTATLTDVFLASAPQVTVFWSPRAQVYGAPAHSAAATPGCNAWVQHVMPSDFWVHREASALPTDAVLCVSTAVQRRRPSVANGGEGAARVHGPGSAHRCRGPDRAVEGPGRSAAHAGRAPRPPARCPARAAR
ncbi:MAG: hypothetical protein ACRDTJ_15215 [Pseudonocardiaceae bacterium]